MREPTYGAERRLKPSISPLGRKEVDVFNSCVNANLVMQENEEVLDVCEAIQTMERRAADKERLSTLLDVIKNLMKVQNESADQVMDKIGVSDIDRKELKRCLL